MTELARSPFSTVTGALQRVIRRPSGRGAELGILALLSREFPAMVRYIKIEGM